jgi:hypothetical protein
MELKAFCGLILETHKSDFEAEIEGASILYKKAQQYTFYIRNALIAFHIFILCKSSQTLFKISSILVNKYKKASQFFLKVAHNQPQNDILPALLIEQVLITIFCSFILQGFLLLFKNVSNSIKEILFLSNSRRFIL